MAKKKTKDSESSSSKLQKIKYETKKSVFGILLIGVSIIMLLAAFHRAGPAGDIIFSLFNGLVGLGYYLFPAILFIVGLLFLISREEKFFGVVFFGMAFFVLSGLGLIDVLFPGKGGFLGGVVGSLEVPFGHGAAIILLITLLITALLITLNASITLRKPSFLKSQEEKDIEKKKRKEDARDDEDEEIDIDELIAEEKEAPAKATKKIAAPAEKPKEKKSDEEFEPVIAMSAGEAKGKSKPAVVKNYVPPPLDLLKSSVEKPTPGDLRANANIIKRTLDSFGIDVEMGEINIGPKVTRYTLKPAEGVKITRITALGQDLALALAAHPIRIEAPIPGKSLVGIEVPNKAASIVRLGSLLSYPDFTAGGQLVFPLGRDVTGEPLFMDIEKLPHLLVAGATGSGKSIFIHSIILPLLYKNSPEMLKLILIDPKRVELSIYEGIPHLISPVITEGKKSIAVFRWALSEMDRRYQTLQQAGSRDIKSYNKANKTDPLPYIVIVIDEMADLMANFGKEIEGYIVRLAQMARATGIHLVLATQRPSVEVITGLIKANITGRAALKVISQIDSRTIIDTAGAEKLLGGGDLLFSCSMAEYSKPKRIQGGYVTEEEIKDVVKFIRDNNETLGPTEQSAESQALAKSMNPPTEPGKAEANTPGGGDVFDDYMGTNDEEDEMLPQAIDVIKQARKASTSLLQRRLGLGYNRAARIIDIMESKGLIGPADGAKPREVYIVDENNLSETPQEETTEE